MKRKAPEEGENPLTTTLHSCFTTAEEIIVPPGKSAAALREARKPVSSALQLEKASPGHVHCVWLSAEAAMSPIVPG